MKRFGLCMKISVLVMLLTPFAMCGETIEGTLVETNSGAPIKKCRVNVLSPRNGINQIEKTDDNGNFKFKVGNLERGSKLLVVVDDINVITDSRIIISDAEQSPKLSDIYKAMSVECWENTNDEDSTFSSVLPKLKGVTVAEKNLKYDNKMLALFLNGRYVTDVRIETTSWYKVEEPNTTLFAKYRRLAGSMGVSVIQQRLLTDCTTAGWRPRFEKFATEIKEESILGDFNAYEYISKIPMSDIQMISIIRKGDNRLDFERNSFGASTIAVNVKGFDRPLFDDEKSGLAIITVK